MIRQLLHRAPWLILLALFMLQWLLLHSIKEPAWDAVSYYVYARSVVFDGDLQFENDYQLSYPTGGEHFASKGLDQVKTATGRVSNLFAVGTALLWMPWLLLLRLLSPLLLAPASALSGYERFFVSNLATFSALIGFLALLISYFVAERAAGRRPALIASATLMFATPLLYYQFREPMYSHSASAFAVALAVWFWWRRERHGASVWNAIGLGVLIGLAALVRWQNLAYLLLPCISAVVVWQKSRVESSPFKASSALVQLLLIGLAAAAVFSLQMFVWQVLYGSLVTVPQGNAFIGWRPLYLMPFLFSTFRGVLPWMPVFFLALAGLLALCRRNLELGLPLLVMLIVAVFINGSTRDWFAGGGFGPRRLTSEFVILVVGYAALINWLPQRIANWVSAVLATLLILHQWILLRFALVERLGGRVMSMAPTFEWEDVPLPQFAAELAALARRAWQQPVDFLVLPGSPLDLVLRNSSWPFQHIATLFLSSLFVAAAVGSAVLLLSRLRPSRQTLIILILAFSLLLAGIDFWIVAYS